ncbi:MAG: beta strand repeat-containing protein [Dehalococcoidia bacterium]
MRFWKRFAAASAAATVATVLGLLLVLMPASGADEIDQEVPGPANGFTLFADDPLQSFQPAQATIRAVEVYLQAEDFEGTFDETDVIVEIWTDGFGALVGSATVPLPENFTGGWLLLNFAPSLNVVPDDTYLLDVYLDAVLPVEEDLGWAYQDTSSYGRGAGTIGGNPVDPDLDFLFRTYYNDPTPPVVDYTLNPASPGDGGWYNVVPVTLTWTITDPDSDVTLIGCVDQTVVAESPMTTYDCTADSNGGTTVHPGVSFGVDLTKPVITLNTITTPNGNGWNNTDVTASFTCTDSGGSGVDGGATNLPNVTLTTEGANQSLSSTGTCVDNAGNVADHITVNGINIDKTAPTSVFLSIIAGTPGSNGWYISDVTVRTNGTDSVSPVTCTADQFQTTDTTPAGQDFNGSCTNAAGLVTNASTLNVKLDETAPTATLGVFSGTLGLNGWYTSNVVMETTGTDAHSGIASCTSNQSFTNETTGITVNGSCMDAAGHVTNAAPFNLKIDKTGPTGVFLSVTAGTSGANGWYTSDVTVHTNGTDNVSPITSCTADQFQTTDTAPAGVDFNGSCTNEAGLVTNAPLLNIKLDKTAPTAVLSVFSGTLGANGWYTSSVVVQTTGTDATSGAPTCTANQTFNFESTGITVNGSCTNAAGLTTNAAPLNIKIDMTAPTSVFLSVTAGALGSNSWYTSDVTVHTNGTDNVSPIVFCTADQFQTTDTTPAGVDFNGYCENEAGLQTNASPLNIKLDKTAPTATLSVFSGTLGANGWYTSAVVVQTTGTDANSGIDSCTPNQTFNFESTGFAVNGSCTDEAGHTTNATPINIKIDMTAPAPVFLSVTAGILGNAGWYLSDVTVHTNGTDAISGVTCTADQFQNADTAGTNFNGSCTNGAGLVTNASQITIKLDKTAPTASLAVLTGTLGNNGWYRSDVVVRTTGFDGLSGLLGCTPDQTFSAESAGFVVNGSCEDIAGNVANATPLPLKIDKTAPVTTLSTTPGAPDGLNGWFINSPVTVHTNGVDALSGIDTCTADDQQTTDTAGQLFSGSCTDLAGNTSSASTTIKLDTTDPDADILVVDGIEGANGWYISTVIAEAFGTDNVSGPVVCTPQIQSYGIETTGHDLEADCTNQAGRMTHVMVHVKIDKTAPVTTLNTLPAAPNGLNGWFTSDVSIFATFVELISNPTVTCTAPFQVTTETTGQLVTVTCTNDAGLSSSASQTIKLDKTGPTDVELSVTDGTLGANGWYTSDIEVSTTGTDNISGPVVCTAPQSFALEADEPGEEFNGECTNQAGLSTPADPLLVKVDKTAPTNVELAVTAGTLGNNGWYTTDVTVETTSDAETISDPVVCTADQQQTVDTAGQEFNGSCTNDAGLTTDADPLVIKLDKTPPTLAPTVPAAIEQNAVASATPNATDAMSGVASQSCGALVTTTLGTFTVQCTATDNAGNTTTVDVQYTVLSTAADCGKILFGTTPPPGGGVGTFAFSCGSIAQLIAVTGCNQATMTIYYNKPGGGYAVYIPGSQVAAVNAEFVTIFNGNPQIPVNTIFSVKCV